MSNKKHLTQFDVLNAMPKGSISVFQNLGGGRIVGKKGNKHGVIEVLVDYDTFQDFAFQSVYGHAKNGKKKIRFVMYGFEEDVYNEAHDKLKTRNK